MFKFWFESIIYSIKKTLNVKGLNKYVGNYSECCCDSFEL